MIHSLSACPEELFRGTVGRNDPGRSTGRGAPFRHAPIPTAGRLLLLAGWRGTAALPAMGSVRLRNGVDHSPAPRICPWSSLLQRRPRRAAGVDVRLDA